MAQKRKVKLNLGCGGNFIKGKEWINVDKFVIPPDKKELIFVEADVRDLPFDKNYADYILLDNVLEHLPQSEIPDVVYEIKRVLKVGGIAVIVVPDFTNIAEEWLEYSKKNAYDFQTHKFYSEIIFGNQIHEGEYHKSAFYPAYLANILHMVGLHKFEIIFAPKGMLTSGLKEFEGIRWDEKSAVRNSMIIAKITK
jgi:predicted SAM-dependent methyltransferase